MSEDLVTWLRARLDEDEALARAVERDLPGRAGEPYEDGSGILDADEYPSYPWGHDSPAELPFMARWHPRTVLAEIGAKRRILEQHEHKRQSISFYPSQGNAGGLMALDAVLRLLALPYAEHHAYRSEWRP